MDFQNEYDTTTGGINEIVSTQLTSSLQWSNIPGTLVKASSSAAGYVWGYNSQNNVFVCQLPCTGNWTMVDSSTWNLSSVLDITTDGSNVYILLMTTAGNTVVYSNSATNTGTWNLIPVPFPAKNLFSTNTYLWVQDGSNNKQKCAKPCTTGNWVANPENKITITSASDSALYGVDASGNAVKTDENLQSPWSGISGLSGMSLKSIFGQSDATALYGVDKTSKAYRCEGDCTTPQNVDPLDTAGYAPLSMAPDPHAKSLWMTATTSSDKGNVFSRLDKPDYTSIMNNITPLDQQRDKLVDDVEHEYTKQTQLTVIQKQLNSIVNFFTSTFKMDTASIQQDKNEVSHMEDRIKGSQQKIDQINAVKPIVQSLLFVLLAVAIVYIVGSNILGQYVHVLAFATLAAGVGFAIYSSRN
jgi:hypothetical protein